MKKLLFVILSAFVFTACSTEKSRLNRAMDFALQNKKEFEKVLEHYKNDSLKLKAAEWLISNMIYQISIDSASVGGNQPYYDLLIEYWQQHRNYNDVGTYYLCDSLYKVRNDTLTSIKSRYKKDIESISSQFMIRHIDQSFESWCKYPWSNNVCFEDFCRYILPYKCKSDFWENAFPYLRNQYAYLADSMSNGTIVEVGKFIENDIKTKFRQDGPFMRAHPYMTPTTQSNYIRSMLGECIQANITAALALRSVGIPAIIDYIPYWGNSNSGHSWVKIIGDSTSKLYDNKQIMFSGEQDKLINDMFWFEFIFPSLPGIPEDVNIRSCRTVPKIYRSHFEIINETVSPEDPSIPILFRDTGLEDVTDEYLECSDVVIPLTNNIGTERWAYLCCYDPDNISWVPVAQGQISGKSAIFKTVGQNIVYLPAIYQKGNVIPIGAPFLLTSESRKKELVPADDNHSVMKLYSKVPYRTNVLYWAYSMVNTQFKLANNKNLSDTITVHNIDKIPYYGQQVVIDENKCYRYGIYEFGGHPGFIGELEFWGIDDSGKETKLKGEPIGNPGLYGQTNRELIDGNRVSFFSRDWNKESFVGFDFGRPYRISKIIYHPRSDDNGIVPGEKYELFYWDNEWKSLGQQEGGNDKTLEYYNVPKNLLFRLHNLTRGQENRIFIYEQGKQIFY